MYRWSDLRLSVENLIEMYARTDSPLFGLVVNLGLAAIGAVIYVAFDGWLEIAGLAWAAINLLGIVKWVVEG